MTNDVYTLNDLRDVAMPPQPPAWPPAPGVWIVLLLVTVALVCLGVMIWSHRRRSAYRRAGLACLEAARTPHEISVILKRVALVTYPRDQVASLYGADWLLFLDRTGDGLAFHTSFSKGLEYASVDDLKDLARQWVRTHRPQVPTRPPRSAPDESGVA